MEMVLVIPGSSPQVPLIKRLHSEGHEVVCINPDDRSPGFEYSDYCIHADILDKENSLRAAKNMK